MCAKKVIIAIHGLGNKPAENLLKKWWRSAILEGMNKAKLKKVFPKFEFIYWADIVHDKPLDPNVKDIKNPYYLDEVYVKEPQQLTLGNHDLRIQVVDFLNEKMNKVFLNDDKTLNYGFISDLFLSKYFHDLDLYYHNKYIKNNGYEGDVKDLVRNKVAAIINKYKSYDILLVAHSMGSIIAFDVLTFLIPEVTIRTFVTIGSPLGIPLVISKIADELRQAVRKNNIEVRTPPSVENWYNLADITDRVAINYKLSDDFSANDSGVLPKDFLVNNTYMMNNIRNPHKSYGYLRTSTFIEILDNFIGEEKAWIGKKTLMLFKKQFHKIKDYIIEHD